MKNPFIVIVLSLFSICLEAQTIISSSISITQADIDGYVWPVVINGGTISSPVIVTLAEDVTITSGSRYFDFESDYVGFDGNNKTVTIASVSDFPGLFRTGYGYGNISVSNTKVHSDGSTLLEEGAWIGRTLFGDGGVNVIISNCSSDGDMLSLAGGITGSYSTCTVINSHSSGQIIGGSGGIFGAYSPGTAINCYSTGNLEIYSGGIMGYNFNGSVADSYSTGSIGEGCGGIVAYFSFGSVSRCYSTGNMTAPGAGGIAGLQSNGSIDNCYTTGNIISGTGGIAGPSNSAAITHCYTTGIITDDGYGIADAGVIDCISENGPWSDANAATALTGEDGTSWTDIDLGSSNTPYKLPTFNETIYSPDNANVSEGASSSFAAGNFTTGNYSIINITGNPSGYSSLSINAGDGIVSVTNAVAGSYVLDIVYSDASDGSYQINNFTLDVLFPLPITWRSFTVTPRGKSAWLEWSTSSEQNTRNFNVQHSINGSNWTTISTMTAAGNSNAISNYSYQHADPVSGNNYYRIQQTDRDGKYSYSAVRQLQVAVTGKSFSVVNTIVNNGLLQVEVKTSLTLYLYSTNGELLWQKEFNAGLKHIDLGTISKGVYFLKGKNAAEKIVVQ